MIDLNGGPPKPPPANLSTERPKFSWEPNFDTVTP